MTKKLRPGQSPKKQPRKPRIVAQAPAQIPSPVGVAAPEEGSAETALPVSRATPVPASRPLAAASRSLSSARSSRMGVARPSNIPTSYGYVISDLKRIGITSGVLFVIIIGLSVVMR